MPKVDGSLGSLVQGVSQQPTRARIPGQATEQLNIVNDEVFGMSRRPATEFVAAFNTVPSDTNGQTQVEYGPVYDDENTLLDYVLRTGPEPLLRVYKSGVAQTVVMDAAAIAYMATGYDTVEGNRIVFSTIDGDMRVLNTEQIPATLADLPAGVTDSTVVYLRGANFATRYTVTVVHGGQTLNFMYYTEDGSAANHLERTTTRYVMSRIEGMMSGVVGVSDYNIVAEVPANNTAWASNGAAAGATFRTHFDYEIINDHLIITPKVANDPYTITATDSYGTDLFEAMKTTIKDVSKLPTRATVGHVVTVVGSNRSEDDYYLKWVVEGKALGDIENLTGIWEETTAPTQEFKLDPTTLPHVLTRVGSTYTLAASEWDERKAGDDESNKMPNFIGEPIQDLIEFQGRTAFFHGQDVTTSATDKYTDMFNQTATISLITDPINVRSTSAVGNTTLKYAVTFNRDILVFGTNGSQFIFGGRQTISPSNATFVPVSSFDIDLNTRPSAIANNIPFMSYTGQYTQVHELFATGQDNNFDRRTLTNHVPRYIVGQPTMFANSDSANVMMVTGSDRTSVKVYEYLWVDNTRVQSAWSEWSFPAEIVSMYIDKGIAVFWTRSEHGALTMVRMELDKQDTEALSYPLHVDEWRKVTLNDTDTIAVAMSDLTGTLVVKASDGIKLRVLSTVIANATQYTNGEPQEGTITLSTTYTGDVYVGFRYKTRFVPTMPVMKDGDGVTITRAGISVADFLITFEQTGKFTMTRETDFEVPAAYWSLDYSGRTLGDPDFILGTVAIDDGQIDFPFSELTTTSRLVLECEEHTPMTLTDIEWSGQVNYTSKRLTNGG